MSKTLNSLFEISIRLLIALTVIETACTADYVMSVDFIAAYERSFGFSDCNLHGDNPYKFGELSARRERTRSALKWLVLNGLLNVWKQDGNILYAPNAIGQDYAQKITGEYAQEYRVAVGQTLVRVRNMSEHNILRLIESKSTQTHRQEG